MNTEIALYAILILVLVAVVYVYWRGVKGVLSSAFRAYDLILSSFLLYVIVARVVGLFMGLGVDYDRIQFDQLLSFTGIRFEYLTIIYIPLLVFQFFNTNLEIRKDWYKQASLPIILGTAIGSILLLINLLISVQGQMADRNSIFFLLTSVVLLAVTVISLYLTVTKRMTNLLNIIILLIASGAIQLCLWLVSGYSVLEVSAMSLSHLILLIIAIYPHLGVEFRLRQEQRELAKRRVPVSAI